MPSTSALDGQLLGAWAQGHSVQETAEADWKTRRHARLTPAPLQRAPLPPALGAPVLHAPRRGALGVRALPAEKRLTVGGRGHGPFPFRKGPSPCRARQKAFDLTARFGFFPWFRLSVILPSEHKVSTFLLFLTFPWPWECLALTARDRSLPCCRGHLPPAGEWRLTLVCVTYCLLLIPCPAPGRSG